MSKGIDIPIEALTSKLSSKLFTTDNFNWYGRAFWNGRNGETIPEVLVAGTSEYKEVLLDDRVDGHNFILPEPTMYAVEGSMLQTYKAEVGIYFAVNLVELYPSETVRATERLHESVLSVLRSLNFKVTRIVSGWDAFSQFGYTSNDKDNMQPYYLCRFDTEIQVSYSQC